MNSTLEITNPAVSDGNFSPVEIPTEVAQAVTPKVPAEESPKSGDDSARKAGTQMSEAASIAKLNKARIDEFNKLDGIIKKFGRDSLEVGKALRKIMKEQLWALGFHSWEDYRTHLDSYGIVHVARLTHAALIVELVETANKENPVTQLLIPESEYQLRPILRSLDNQEKLEVWRQACLRIGGQPKNKDINRVRLELFPKSRDAKPAKTKQNIFKALKDVETLLDSGAPSEDVKEALIKLSKILKVDHMEEDELSDEIDEDSALALTS